MPSPRGQRHRRQNKLPPSALRLLIAGLVVGISACLVFTVRLHASLLGGGRDGDGGGGDRGGARGEGDAATTASAAAARARAPALRSVGGSGIRADSVARAESRDNSTLSPPPQKQQPQRHPPRGRGQTVGATVDEGLSACLLVNDENPRLPEWIAYHYTALPLRSLIVAVDPASRSSPNEILMRWYEELGLDVRPWSEKKYLPNKMRGACRHNDTEKCLWHHRDRQQYFVMKCMLEHKRSNRTWVALVDVDEYIVFNGPRSDDPLPPFDEPPVINGEAVPTMTDWKVHKVGRFEGSEAVDGTVDGVRVRSGVIISKPPGTGGDDTIMYGTVVTDSSKKRYFLRDDVAHYESIALRGAPPGVPTCREPWFAGTKLFVRIYNDTYDGNPDGTFLQLRMSWEMGDDRMRRFKGGSLFEDAANRTYYLENEAALWPRRPRAADALRARLRLPSVGDANATVLNVLNGEARVLGRGGRDGWLGPCLSMPRLLYGSREDDDDGAGGEQPPPPAAPEGFSARDFATLRYRWHASKGQFEASKYPKTLIDVSRIPEEALRKKKALNIHRPLTYYCRKDPPRYVLSLFRVNHYLDSYEAYSYRNDARSNLRKCEECYRKKGEGAAVAMDNDIQPWLQRFVDMVGPEKAKRLLSGAGDFVELG